MTSEPQVSSTKSFNFANNKTITRKYCRVKKSDLSKVLGTDKDDVNDGFASNANGLSGFFCPRPGCYDNRYVAAAICGLKPCFKNDEVTVISLPSIDECGLNYLRDEVYQLPTVMQYIPDRFYRKGDLKGQVIIDDVTFTASIFAKVEPLRYNAWIDRQQALNDKRLKKEDTDYIEIDLDWWLKLLKQKKTIHKKGKSGPMVFNYKRKVELKRKRLHIEKLQTLNELKADKVWLPFDNDIVEENTPADKDFVLLKDYKEVKSKNIAKDKEFTRISNMVKKQPFESIRGVADEQARYFVYNNSRTSLMNTWSNYNLIIPTYEEATNIWGNNSN